MKKLKFYAISFTLFLPATVLAHGAATDDEYMHMMDMHWGNGGGMMGGGFWGVLFFLTWLVWLAVGVLAAVYLWQRINKK